MTTGHPGPDYSSSSRSATRCSNSAIRSVNAATAASASTAAILACGVEAGSSPDGARIGAPMVSARGGASTVAKPAVGTANWTPPEDGLELPAPEPTPPSSN